MKKKVALMPDRELTEAYREGMAWLAGNGKERKGYDPILYFKGIVRMEEIKKEMAKRGMIF